MKRRKFISSRAFITCASSNSEKVPYLGIWGMENKKGIDFHGDVSPHLCNTLLNNRILLILLHTLYVLAFAASGYSQVPFASTPLNVKGDFSSLMVEGIDRF